MDGESPDPAPLGRNPLGRDPLGHGPAGREWPRPEPAGHGLTGPELVVRELVGRELVMTADACLWWATDTVRRSLRTTLCVLDERWGRFCEETLRRLDADPYEVEEVIGASETPGAAAGPSGPLGVCTPSGPPGARRRSLADIDEAAEWESLLARLT